MHSRMRAMSSKKKISPQKKIWKFLQGLKILPVYKFANNMRNIIINKFDGIGFLFVSGLQN